MINRNYFYRNFKEHWLLLTFAFLLVGAMQYLIVMLVVEMNILTLAQSFMSRMPPQMQQFFGEELFAQFSIGGAIAFGYTHPFVLVMLSLLAITLPVKHIAGEIENGALELILALPVRRSKIAFSLWFLSITTLLIAVCGGVAGSGLAMLVYPDTRTVPFKNIILIALNLWLLMLVINSFAFLLSAFVRESGKAAMPAAVVMLVFYFLNFIVKTWTDVQSLAPFTLFNYFQPQKLMIGAAHIGQDFLVLIGLTLLFGLIAMRKIVMRDIPG